MLSIQYTAFVMLHFSEHYQVFVIFGLLFHITLLCLLPLIATISRWCQ